MLSWLESLYSDWKGGDSAGSETRRSEASREENEGGDASPASACEETGTPTRWQDLLDGETVSKQEVQVELGLQPHEFLAWLVRSSGGRMWQADMVDTTGWSKSTVSRYLDTLESNEVVERVRIGRRKLVGVPEEMPTGSRTPDAPAGPAEDALGDGRWADEAI
ncbi:helix-turn-helix transcriptional regulator [Salinirubellus sp. GCM10025818]|uniref:helix-turn-helix transcriptional regulator n=1 Tax=Salinirubellus TaxID=2162630 RepID=UPI0030CD1B13